MAAVMAASHYPKGDHAALRRWAPGQPVPLAFYRLWLRHINAELPPESQTPVWMMLAWGLATMGEGAHDPRRPLGQALAESKFTEGRLERLLSAPEEVRLELFMDAVRFLAAKDESFDWREAAQFLLTTDPAKREALHRRIAAAFYRHQPQES
jgi:CRISPR system Cascade subunit CasB